MVASAREQDRSSSACPGCGSELRIGEWACARCRAEATGDRYLRMLDDSTFPDGYDASLFETLAALEAGSFWFRGRNKIILWALDRWFPSARSLLEVGCGTGFVLSAIVRSRPELDVVGGELFPEGLQVARRRLAGVPLAQMDARALKIDSAFDVVCAFDVLEHLDRDEDALASMRTAVRPGGGLLVTVPQHRWLWSEADEFAGHVRRYTRTDLSEKVRRAGYEVIWASSFLTFLLPLIATSRLARRGSYSLAREFALPRRADLTFERVLDLERRAMARGVSLPTGGSLLLAARRPPEGARP